MATRKKSKTPAVRYLKYELTNSGTPGTETSHYIDLARDLSAINRRLYRQGRVYHVKRITVVSRNTIAAPGGTAGFISASAAPNSWVVRNAWKRGFEVMKEMNKQATVGVSGNIAGTWADFKVHLDATMKAATLLTPIDSGGNAVSLGEWVYSKFVTPDGTASADEFEVTLLGNDVGAAGSRDSVGLVKSYANSRVTVSNPDPTVFSGASEDPLANVFDHGTVIDNIIDDLEADNDNPPYDATSYTGGASNMPKALIHQETTLGADGRGTMGGFEAICGLIELETTSPVASDTFGVLVELAPGNYRGIAAEVI